MNEKIDAVFDGLDEAEALLGRVCKVIASVPGIDIADDTNLQRLRRIREDIGEVRDRIEEMDFDVPDAKRSPLEDLDNPIGPISVTRPRP